MEIKCNREPACAFKQANGYCGNTGIELTEEGKCDRYLEKKKDYKFVLKKLRELQNMYAARDFLYWYALEQARRVVAEKLVREEDD